MELTEKQIEAIQRCRRQIERIKIQVINNSDDGRKREQIKAFAAADHVLLGLVADWQLSTSVQYIGRLAAPAATDIQKS